MLFMVCDSAPVPLTWVMAVAVGVSWWCVFQWCVAVVWASRRVPGVCGCLGVVGWVVSCVGVVLVWLWVSGVSGAKACVAGLVCVSWFRMLMCVPFFFLGFVFCLVWLITGCLGFWCVGWVGGWCACSWPVLVCFFLFGEGVSCVGWCRAGPWCALGGLLGCCFLLFVFARCERCVGGCLCLVVCARGRVW